jgi:two-component system OmpR family sensor kinase
VPIRVRLTLAFALAMAVVLAATGVFLYLRLGSALDSSINQGLRARAADVAALVEQADTGLRESRTLRGPDSGFAQAVTAAGKVVDSTPGLATQTLLDAAQLERARNGRTFFEQTLGDEPVRLLAVPVTAQGQRLVVIVGSSLEPRAVTLAKLQGQLLVGGPMALLLASVLGYLLAAAALRPVERMGERAATISTASPGRRLPVPRANDEISRLGRRLNDMLARLEAGLERERALVSNASHELRTPLALLKTEIELALDEPDSAPALAAALRSAGEETDRLAQLADDLLLLARVDAGELPLRRTAVPIPNLLQTIATRFRRRADDAGRSIEVVAASDLVALIDRRRVEQALTNLVENALRHGDGTIVLRALGRPDALELHVADEGPGFPPAFAERAFERFSRADASRGGAGLGLAIVAAIAEAHHGAVTAANTPAGGADVALIVPVHDALPFDGASRSRSATETGATIRSRR